MMLRLSLMASLAASSFLVIPAAAEEPMELDDIIVSGGLSPISADSLGRASTVITAETIEERGIATVQDALRALPGVSVNGTSNSSTQVRIRGGEANHTLVLIDGVEAAGGDGDYSFSGLEATNIERIEVLRGPQSVYYGSNASSGVINIITRKGGQGSTYTASVEAGDALSARAFTSHRDERGGISISASRVDDRGYDQSGDGGERDGLERSSVGVSGDYLLTDELKLGFNVRYADENFEFDSTSFTATDAAGYIVDDPTQVSTRTEFTGALYGEFDMFEGRLTHRLSFEKTEFRSTFNNGPRTVTDTEALKYRLSYGLDGQAVTNTNHLLSVLLENERDGSSTNPLFDRETNSVAAEYRGSFEFGLDVQAGARFDENDTFKDAATWNVGLSYQVPDTGVRLHGSAGTGIVNPTYFELFADSFGFVGNQNLRPERNRSFDIGAELTFWDGRGVLDVTYFNERLKNEITSVQLGDGSSSFINQAGNSDRQGVEVGGTLQATDELSLRLSYTHIDAENPDGSIEVRRPRHEISAGATLSAFDGRGSFSADVRHVAGNADTQFFGSFNTETLPSYTTVDLAAHYDLTENVTVTGRVTNLFNDDAVDVWGFASRGRAGYVGLSAKF